ncbi:PREDICTED: uncharacterized skeletal organic matrix protein 6 isoform X1 [Acropora digitifera]|uniref:uncharacterized skeletal organic matrix protein 6 isoform X1 n=1 Tax=Acropora digitifera TaxID=70779 RepID=UPI00077AED58|nr:PREDICTED: uncharacterized skeletal organic matrix protein 6 isoform X1 [Acropora digitifera]
MKCAVAILLVCLTLQQAAYGFLFNEEVKTEFQRRKQSLEEAGESLKQMGQNLQDNMQKSLAEGQEALQKHIKNLQQSMLSQKEALRNRGEALRETVGERLESMQNQGKDWMKKMQEGRETLQKKLGEQVETLNQTFQAGRQAITKKVLEGSETMRKTIQNTTQSLQDKAEKVQETAGKNVEALKLIARKNALSLKESLDTLRENSVEENMQSLRNFLPSQSEAMDLPKEKLQELMASIQNNTDRFQESWGQEKEKMNEMLRGLKRKVGERTEDMKRKMKARKEELEAELKSRGDEAVQTVMEIRNMTVKHLREAAKKINEIEEKIASLLPNSCLDFLRSKALKIVVKSAVHDLKSVFRMGWLGAQEALEKEEEIAPSTEEDGSEELQEADSYDSKVGGESPISQKTEERQGAEERSRLRRRRAAVLRRMFGQWSRKS